MSDKPGNTCPPEELFALWELTGLTMTQFAHALGLHHSTVKPYLYENRRCPRAYVLAARWICLTLGHAIEIDRTEVQRYLGSKR